MLKNNLFKEVYILFFLCLVNINILWCATITASAEHPFFIINNGWIPANTLQVNDIIHTKNEKGVCIDTITQKTIKKKRDVYNLSIEKNPTFFVSEQALLVHNNKCIITSENDAILSSRQSPEENYEILSLYNNGIDSAFLFGLVLKDLGPVQKGEWVMQASRMTRLANREWPRYGAENPMGAHYPMMDDWLESIGYTRDTYNNGDILLRQEAIRKATAGGTKIYYVKNHDFLLEYNRGRSGSIGDMLGFFMKHKLLKTTKQHFESTGMRVHSEFLNDESFYRFKASTTLLTLQDYLDRGWAKKDVSPMMYRNETD